MGSEQNVVVGYCHGPTLTQEFHHCLFRLAFSDAFGPQRILDYVPQYASVNISGARNQMVHEFLERVDAEWLWMLDSDATFAPNLLHLMLEVADPDERPIVGALAYQVRFPPEGGLDATGVPVRRIVPTMYRQERDADGTWLGYRELESFGRGLLDVDATGCHCLLVHRAVFEKTKADHPHPWFRESVIDGVEGKVLAGEDITFCLAARDAGFRIVVDTRLESGHVKPFTVTSLMATVAPEE